MLSKIHEVGIYLGAALHTHDEEEFILGFLELPVKTQCPIIGIPCQPQSREDDLPPTYLHATYVKFIEGAGGRVVPLPLTLTEDELRSLLRCVNGVLLPGGRAPIPDSLYYKRAKIIYDTAVEFNEKGDYFPLYGVCHGFQVFAKCSDDRISLDNCPSVNISKELHFTKDALRSRFYAEMPKSLMQQLASSPISYHNNKYGINMNTYLKSDLLQKQFTILTTCIDGNGQPFCSSMEGKMHPFYAVQWHPEKPVYAFSSDLNATPCRAVVDTSQYFANFLIDEARKSGHRFSSRESEDKWLIYNHQQVFYGSHRNPDLCYLFPNENGVIRAEGTSFY